VRTPSGCWPTFRRRARHLSTINPMPPRSFSWTRSASSRPFIALREICVVLIAPVSVHVLRSIRARVRHAVRRHALRERVQALRLDVWTSRSQHAQTLLVFARRRSVLSPSLGAALRRLWCVMISTTAQTIVACLQQVSVSTWPWQRKTVIAARRVNAFRTELLRKIQFRAPSRTNATCLPVIQPLEAATFRRLFVKTTTNARLILATMPPAAFMIPLPMLCQCAVRVLVRLQLAFQVPEDVRLRTTRARRARASCSHAPTRPFVPRQCA